MFHVEHLLLLFFTIISKNATINSLFHVNGTKTAVNFRRKIRNVLNRYRDSAYFSAVWKQQKVQMGYYG